MIHDGGVGAPLPSIRCTGAGPFLAANDRKLFGYDDKLKSYLKDMENMRTDSNTIQSQIVVASSQINSNQDSQVRLKLINLKGGFTSCPNRCINL